LTSEAKSLGTYISSILIFQRNQKHTSTLHLCEANDGEEEE
jgi:hypothetical protein